MIHQTAITENKLRRIMKSCAGLVEDYELERSDGLVFPNGMTYDALRLNVTKKKAKSKGKKK